MMNRLLSTALLLLVALSAFAHDPVLPPGFAFEQNFVTGLEQPTDLKIAPDGRIFITEKPGRVRIVENGQLLPQPFYTVATQTPYERGLDGIVLDPDFENNGYVYLYYTLPFSNQNRLARITSAGNTAVPGSEIELMRFDTMTASWHNGGGMLFDTTGKLIVGIGDGTGYTPWMTTNRAKILRLNPDGSIPTDNFYYNQNTGIYRAIIASGVRNPYTMAISKLSGRIFFNDVGLDTWEEVNELFPGKNYGWPFIEGMKDSTQGSAANYLDPIHVFHHDDGCAVVGATFYEPNVSLFPPDYYGKYFFLEYCESKLLYLDPDTYAAAEFGVELGYGYNNLETSPDGYLYLVNVNKGTLARISYQGINSPPLISIQPEDKIAAAGESVVFSVVATGDTLSYEWYLNGNLAQASTSNFFSLSNVQLPDDQAAISVRVFNPHGFVDSDTARLTVVNGTRPSIQFQGVTSTYAAGDTIHYSAVVTDADQQIVPLADWTWKIEFHHDDHAHPALSALSGVDSGIYPVETSGEVDTNVFFRIHLTALDSSGLDAQSYVDVLPEKVSMLIQSFPPGVEISVDGNTETTDFSMRSVRNLLRTIRVPSWAVLGDSLYDFVEWWDAQDTLIRDFNAQTDTVSVQYQAVARYYPSYPTVGNMDVYKDTASSRVYYKSSPVSRIQENWDVLNPYIWDQPAFPNDYWSVHWNASVVAPVSDLYTFYLYHDSRASLWVNDSLLIDRSVVNVVKDDTARIWLNGGDSVRIEVDYDHYTYLARVELDWSYSVVPRHNLIFSTLEPPVASEPPFEILLDDGAVVLYPNPSDAETVSLYLDSGAYFGKKLAVQVYDVMGRRMQSYQGTVGDAPLPFSVAGYTPGIYLFWVTAGDREKVIRFVLR